MGGWARGRAAWKPGQKEMHGRGCVTAGPPAAARGGAALVAARLPPRSHASPRLPAGDSPPRALLAPRSPPPHAEPGNFTAALSTVELKVNGSFLWPTVTGWPGSTLLIANSTGKRAGGGTTAPGTKGCAGGRQQRGCAALPHALFVPILPPRRHPRLPPPQTSPTPPHSTPPHPTVYNDDPGCSANTTSVGGAGGGQGLLCMASGTAAAGRRHAPPPTTSPPAPPAAPFVCVCRRRWVSCRASTAKTASPTSAAHLCSTRASPSTRQFTTRAAERS